MENNVSESGVLKRKLEEDGTDQTVKEPELSSPPAKIRPTDVKRSEQDPSRANVLDMAPSTSSSNQTTSIENSGETYGEREKMQ